MAGSPRGKMPRQRRRVLCFLWNYLQEHGTPAAVTDVQAFLEGNNITPAHNQMTQLARFGYIEVDRGHARSHHLTEKGLTFLGLAGPVRYYQVLEGPSQIYEGGRRGKILHYALMSSTPAKVTMPELPAPRRPVPPPRAVKQPKEKPKADEPRTDPPKQPRKRKPSRRKRDGSWT